MEDQATWKTETTKPYEKVMVSHYTYSETDKTYVAHAKGEALLYGFGYDIMKGNEGNFASFSVGIIEWPDGKLELVPIDLIRFIEPHTGG
jgi:hypothetical protein